MVTLVFETIAQKTVRRLVLLSFFLLAVNDTLHANTKYLFVQPDASAAPAIVFVADTVHVSGMTPGGDIVLFAASVESQGGIPVERTGAKIFRDDDRDGGLAYKRNRAVGKRSVWVAVDLETGRYVTSTPDSKADRFLAFPKQLLRRDAEGVVGLFDIDQTTAEMLIVRPKLGAWRLRASEGGSGDADRLRNGKLGLAAEEAISLRGTGPPPKRLQNGDLMVVIDPGRLNVVVLEIGKE